MRLLLHTAVIRVKVLQTRLTLLSLLWNLLLPRRHRMLLDRSHGLCLKGGAKWPKVAWFFCWEGGVCRWGRGVRWWVGGFIGWGVVL